MTHFIVQTDSIIHFWTGIMICALLCLAFYNLHIDKIGSALLALLITVICGSLKEVLWDDMMRMGSIEYTDWVMTIFGALTICVAWFFSGMPHSRPRPARRFQPALEVDAVSSMQYENAVLTEIFPTVVTAKTTDENRNGDSEDVANDNDNIVFIDGGGTGAGIQRVSDVDRDRRAAWKDVYRSNAA